LNSQIALFFRDVCFAYEHQEVLHNVDLSVPDKSLVAVVGPNGGGKTTLLRLALGLLKPRRGTITIFGKMPEHSRCNIGYVAQHLHFDPAFPVSVLDVVLMGRVDRYWLGPYRKCDRAKAIEALEQVSLGHLSHRALSHLSGGERQRVLIAQALVSDPILLFLDEPTANVDTAVEHEIYDLLHKLNERMTIVVVSHNLNVVTHHASHIACVNRTASFSHVDKFSKSELNAFRKGDMTVLSHGHNCHVLDPRDAVREAYKCYNGDSSHI
jgi:zinc transport system ATP-binding protein